MYRYTLRTARVTSPLERAREQRRLDGWTGGLPGFKAWRSERAQRKQADIERDSNEKRRRQHARSCLPTSWLSRNPVTSSEFPSPQNLLLWQLLGAHDALMLMPPRVSINDPRQCAAFYAIAWMATNGTYMQSEPQSDDSFTPPEHPPMLGPWRTSAHSTPLLDEAMCTAQEMLDPALKTSNNPHFKSKYADLAEIIAVVKPAFAHARIARYQAAWTDDKPGVVITTRLAHKGEWCEADLRIPVDKNNAQALGAAVTYGKRFGLAAMAGVPTEDDDGNAAAAAPPPNAKTDAIGARCSGDKWPGDLGREIDQLVQDLATLDGDDPGNVWWPLLEDAGVNQQPYMDTDGEWPGMARVLSTSDGKLVKATALKKIADARQS